jgi:diacylglycerol kinase family enzyme
MGSTIKSALDSSITGYLENLFVSCYARLSRPLFSTCVPFFRRSRKTASSAKRKFGVGDIARYFDHVLVFVNPRSGIGQGTRVASDFDALLEDNGTVILLDDFTDLSKNPSSVIAAHAKLRRHQRLLIVSCGGDGTHCSVLGAVYEALELQLFDRELQPVCLTLPVGTGNMLPMEFGWASGEAGRFNVKRYLKKIRRCHVSVLDSWHIRVDAASAPSPASSSSSSSNSVPAVTSEGMNLSPPNSPDGPNGQSVPRSPSVPHSTSHLKRSSSKNLAALDASEPAWLTTQPAHATRMTSFFSIGWDAQVMYEWQLFRYRHPRTSAKMRILSKAINGFMGLKQMTGGKHLQDFLTLTIDGQPVVIPKAARCIVVINHGSYANGSRIYRPTKEERKTKGWSDQRSGDGLVEVVAMRSPLSLAALTLKVGRPTVLGQGRHVHLEAIPGHETPSIAFQVDGEPWKMTPSSIDVSHGGAVDVLCKKSSKAASGASRGIKRGASFVKPLATKTRVKLSRKSSSVLTSAMVEPHLASRSTVSTSSGSSSAVSSRTPSDVSASPATVRFSSNTSESAASPASSVVTSSACEESTVEAKRELGDVSAITQDQVQTSVGN